MTREKPSTASDIEIHASDSTEVIRGHTGFVHCLGDHRDDRAKAARVEHLFSKEGDVDVLAVEDDSILSVELVDERVLEVVQDIDGRAFVDVAKTVARIG